uniref:Uncharacterized protein n=1 Tax=Arundo donax TaxID=35708 RepID=A0A0A8YA94_ARUDO
MAHLPTGAAC